MPLNFPNSPTDGQTFTYNTSIFVFSSASNTWLTAISNTIPNTRVLFSDGGVANGIPSVTYHKSNDVINITGTLNLLG